MKYRRPLVLGLASLILFCLFPLAAFSQYREYYIYGKVVDISQQPIPKVEIILQDIETSRNYKVNTDKKGEYSLVGLPHGKYRVTIKKDGYEAKTDEWNFEVVQERLQKVEMGTIVLATQGQIQEIERKKQGQKEFSEATEKIRQGDLDGAIAILAKMIGDNQNDANAHYLLGIAYLRKKMLPEAIASFSKTTELAPAFAGVYNQLGLCYQQQKEPGKALEFYQKALEIDAKNADILYNVGLILFEQNKIPEALAFFEKALELRSQDPEFLEMAGRCYIHQGDFARAIACLEKAQNALKDEEKIKFLEQLIAKLKEQLQKK